jgi:toxin YoeB
MVNWQVILSKQAAKDAKRLSNSGLKDKAQEILAVLQENPFEPPYEKLLGNLRGYYSRRINIQHRIVYEVIEEEQTVRILRMWTHYE